MANELKIGAVTGLTVTLQLYSGLATVGVPFSAAEIGATGEYVASMPSAIPYGRYMVLATVGVGVKIASGEILWDGGYEFIESLTMLEGLNPNSAMTVTPTSRKTGNVDLVISGDGETQTIVTRTP